MDVCFLIFVGLDNRTLIINFKEKNLTGLPDGMAIDNEDKLWVTSFNGHMVNIRNIIKKYFYINESNLKSSLFADFII